MIMYCDLVTSFGVLLCYKYYMENYMILHNDTFGTVRDISIFVSVYRSCI